MSLRLGQDRQKDVMGLEGGSVFSRPLLCVQTS
jgi:hypothetical protein